MPDAWLAVLRQRPLAWAAAGLMAVVLMVAVMHSASFRGFVHPQRVDYRASPDAMDTYRHHHTAFASYDGTYAP